MTGRSALLAALLLLAVATGVAHAQVAARVEVSPPQVGVDGTVRLRVIVEGDEVSDVYAPALPDLAEWTVVTGPSISTQVRYVNGRRSASRTFSWVLAPTRAGNLLIPSLTLDMGGQTVRTQPAQVAVTSGTPSRGSQRGSPPVPGVGLDDGSSSGDLFVRATAQPDDPYVGQQVLLTYELFTRVEVASLPQLQEVPTYPNFWVEEIEGPNRISSRRAVVEGREYHVYAIRKVALFPTSSGDTILGPVTFSIPVRAPRSTLRRSFFFDPVETAYRRTLPVTLSVRPLPAAGRPPGFSNAVGSFGLQVEADREEAGVGDAIGLSVTVTGTGNPRSLTAPALDPSPDFTVYAPEQSGEFSPNRQDLFAGHKSWNYILVPRIPGRQTLPPVHFSFFDPQDGRYHSLTREDLEVTVTGTAMAEDAIAVIPERRQLERLGSDIHFIKTPVTLPPSPGPPLYRTSWFWVGLLAPPLLNLSGLLYRWQTRRYENRVADTRRRRARRLALRRLRRAAGQAGANGQHFYGLVAQALTEYVADKFGHQAAGLTYDRIASLLSERSVPDAAAGNFLKVLEECDCARFSPGTDDAASREDLLSRAGDSLGELGNHL